VERCVPGSCGCGGVGWCELIFSKKDLGLIRRFWRNDRSLGLAGNSKWGYLFSGYYRTLPNRLKKLFRILIKSIPRSLCERMLIDWLKEFSTNIMEFLIEYEMIELRYFLDLKVLGGFDTILNRDDPFEDYRHDYGPRKQGDVPERLQFWILDTIRKIQLRPQTFEFKDFVSFRDAWALPGASVQGSSKKVDFIGEDGSKAGIKIKNKWFAMSHLSDTQIYEQCMTVQDAIVKPFVKSDEPAANRTVQCYDTYSLIRCSCIESAISDFNGNGQWTTMGMNMEDKLAFRRNIFSKNLNWLCTDQSGFDIHQKKEWVLFALDSLFDRIGDLNPQWKDMIEVEKAILRRTYLYYDEIKLEWGNGVLSGYKFTALVDSILNRAESMCVVERVHGQVLFECYQGDDAIIGFKNEVDKELVVSEYEAMGLEVHPQKTWYSSRVTEFLHEIYFEGGVFGFPARSFKSIAWRSPNRGFSEHLGPDKIKAYLSTILMAWRRGLVVYDILLRFCKSVGLKDGPDFQSWIRTPVVFGGFGAGNVGRTKLEFKVESKLKFHIKVEGVIGGKFYESAAVRRVRGSCPMPQMTTKMTWMKVPGDESMPQLRMSILSDAGSIRIDWRLDDLGFFSDAYSRKLILEWKLERNEKILQSDLPMEFLGLADINSAYRRYRKLVGMALSLETSMSAAETYSRYSSWANRVWAGVAMEWALGKISDWVKQKDMLGVTILEMVTSEVFLSSYLRICV
jgi:hypothetical protein